jgi:hypothetical protein
MNYRRIAILSLIVPLAACSLFNSKERAEMRAMRKTPDYRAGYQDGCSSAYGPDANARNGTDQVKDEDSFRTSKAYRTGWSAGITACRTYTPRNTVPDSAGPIPDRNPGNGGIP